MSSKVEEFLKQLPGWLEQTGKAEAGKYIDERSKAFSKKLAKLSNSPTGAALEFYTLAYVVGRLANKLGLIKLDKDEVLKALEAGLVGKPQQAFKAFKPEKLRADMEVNLNKAVEAKGCKQWDDGPEARTRKNVGYSYKQKCYFVPTSLFKEWVGAERLGGTFKALKAVELLCLNIQQVIKGDKKAYFVRIHKLKPPVDAPKKQTKKLKNCRKKPKKRR